MACNLTKSAKSGVDFEGNSGNQVQLDITSDSGGATIVSAVYDGTTLSSPWQFTLSAGAKFLTVLVDDPVPRDWTTLQEKCNGGRNTLKHYPFDPYGPTQTLIIEAI